MCWYLTKSSGILGVHPVSVNINTKIQYVNYNNVKLIFCLTCISGTESTVPPPPPLQNLLYWRPTMPVLLSDINNRFMTCHPLSSFRGAVAQFLFLPCSWTNLIRPTTRHRQPRLSNSLIPLMPSELITVKQESTLSIQTGAKHSPKLMSCYYLLFYFL